MHHSPSLEISFSEEVADLLHELVVLVIKLHISALCANLLFVKLIFGFLRQSLILENDEG